MKQCKISEYSDLLTVKEVQEILKVGRTITYKLLHNGEIRYLKIGNAYRIPKSHLKKYIHRKTNST